MLPDSTVETLWSVRGEGTKPRTAKIQCDKLTVSFFMLWWKHPALVSAEIWGLSYKLHSTGHATEAAHQELSCALCKDRLQATTSTESLLKASEPPATCHRRNQILFMPELGGGTSVF